MNSFPRFKFEPKREQFKPIIIVHSGVTKMAGVIHYLSSNFNIIV